MKFFKWSLVPTKQIERLEQDKSYIETLYCKLIDNCKDKKATYKCYYNFNSYIVVRVSKLENTAIAIKEFPFDEDEEYARICAEELIEHLNETI